MRLPVSQKGANVWRAFKRIHLVDRCLLILLGMLMIQSIFNLFGSKIGVQESHTIDVAFRTSAAGIFGYFISANFTPNRKSKKPKAEPGPAAPETRLVPSKEKPANAAGEEPSQPKENSPTQVVIVAAIGIISLGLLLLFRNIGGLSPDVGSTVAQLRDFVSGCVGFLVSSSTSGNSSE